MTTHYDVLGVSRNAETKDIRSAYRALLKTHHPDAAPDKKDSRRFEDITAAYTVLSNPDRRRQYDQTLAGQPAENKPAAFRFREFKEWLLSHAFFRVFFAGKRVSRNAGSASQDLRDLPVSELLERIVYSKNLYVQLNAVRAIFARGGSSEAKDLLRLLHSGVDDSVKEEILNGLKANREPGVRDAIQSVYETEKSLRLRKMIRQHLQEQA